MYPLIQLLRPGQTIQVIWWLLVAAAGSASHRPSWTSANTNPALAIDQAEYLNIYSYGHSIGQHVLPSVSKMNVRHPIWNKTYSWYNYTTIWAPANDWGARITQVDDSPKVPRHTLTTALTIALGHTHTNLHTQHQKHAPVPHVWT